MEREIRSRQSNESHLQRKLLENSMRSPTSEVGESFSVLRDSLSVLEENKTMNAQLDPEGKFLTLMVAGDNG